MGPGGLCWSCPLHSLHSQHCRLYVCVCAGNNGDEEEGPRCGLPRQVQLLFGRSWRQVTRDKPTNIGRAMSQISSAVVFAGIYWRMGRLAPARVAAWSRSAGLQMLGIGYWWLSWAG